MMVSLKYIIYVCLVFSLFLRGQGCTVNAKELNSAQQPKIDFEKRLNYYLDLHSKGFVKKMAVKEQFLLQMIQNLTDEMKSRGLGEELLKLKCDLKFNMKDLCSRCETCKKQMEEVKQ